MLARTREGQGTDYRTQCVDNPALFARSAVRLPYCARVPASDSSLVFRGFNLRFRRLGLRGMVSGVIRHVRKVLDSNARDGAWRLRSPRSLPVEAVTFPDGYVARLWNCVALYFGA